MFSMLGPAGSHGLQVLDIYAGTGALGIEALQRGAENASFVEQNLKSCNEIKKKSGTTQFDVKRNST